MIGLATITIRQPWAALMAAGVKTVETRSWATKHRGPVAIHAGRDMREFWRIWDRGHQDAYIDEAVIVGALMPLELDPMLGDEILPTGAIVAAAELVDCVPIVNHRDVDHHHDLRDAQRQGRWLANGGGLVLWRQEGHVREELADHSDQRPFGVFTPGRWAWLLDDIKPTTERCPACWETDLEDGIVPCVIHRGQSMDEACFACWNGEPCPVCDGKTRCNPIPAKGRQGVWRWSPGAPS